MEKKLSRRSKIKRCVKAVSDSCKKKEKPKVEFLNSGSTMLNLAASQSRNGGHARGRIVNYVGDGSSGKSLLALEACANFIRNIKDYKSEIYPKVKSYSVVYDNVEGVMDFPLSEMFGKEFEKEIEWRSSPTVEVMGRDFSRRIKALKKGHALLYVIDSWDALDANTEMKSFDDSVDKDKEIKGSYNLGKQSFAWKFFRSVCKKIQGKDATLIVISHSKKKIGVTFGKKTYRSGGDALNYYTHQVGWLAQVEKISSPTVKGKKRIIGIKVKVKYERSKVSKPFREATFDILFDYGIDDIGSMIDFIYGSKAKGFKFKGTKFKDRKALIKYIEKNNLEEDLKIEAEKLWLEVEDKTKPKRKRKY